MTSGKREFIDSMRRGDFEKTLSMIHPECIIRHPPGLPYGGDVIGPKGFRGILDALSSEFDLDVPKIEVLDVDDYLIVRFWATFIHKKSKKSTTMTTVEIYRFEDGLVVEQDNYYKAPERVTELMKDASENMATSQTHQGEGL